MPCCWSAPLFCCGIVRHSLEQYFVRRSCSKTCARTRATGGQSRHAAHLNCARDRRPRRTGLYLVMKRCRVSMLPEKPGQLKSQTCCLMLLDLYEISSHPREELRQLSAILACHKNFGELVSFKCCQMALGGCRTRAGKWTSSNAWLGRYYGRVGNCYSLRRTARNRLVIVSCWLPFSRKLGRHKLF